MEKLSYMIEHWLDNLVILLVGVMGGVVSILQQTVIFKTREFSWKFAIAEVIISAFAGVITFFLCSSNGLSWQLCAAVTGISGNMGSKIIFAFHGVVCNYLKCNKNNGD